MKIVFLNPVPCTGRIQEMGISYGESEWIFPADIPLFFALRLESISTHEFLLFLHPCNPEILHMGLHPCNPSPGIMILNMV
ncbi:hypothetical protein CBFG_04586 [Clostridiales bacterium 1_7_47FAA]|nr:hypothetical protein CBFG_04586 [Clostridiales bacterium 1_7_47FAA]